MAYKEKDTKKWTAQWFETNAKGEKKKRRKRGFSTKKEALEYERQKKLNSSRSMDMKLSEFMEVYFEDNCIISLDCGKWKSGLRTTPNSQGRMDALAIDDPVEYVKLMLGGEMQVWLDALDDCSVW